MRVRHGGRASWLRAGCLAAALAASGAVAQDAPDEASEERELLALLAEETDIATKTRMNSDYVPGIVTVLHGDELEALGVHSVWEALSLVPGIQIVRDERGSPSMTVRGIDFIFNSGNTKVLVNDVSMSRESAGANSSILLLPIEQVERIEMIRGPGSAIHGDFAFQGLINVVTRQEPGRVLVRGQDPSSITAVVGDGWTSKKEKVRGSVSFSGLWSEDADSPVTFDAEEERRSAVLGIEGPFGWFRGQAVTRELEPDVAPGPGIPTPLDEENWALAWGGRFGLGRGWSIDAHAARSSTEHDLGPRLLFEGDVTELGLDFVRESDRHDTIIGVAWWSGETDRAAVTRPPPAPSLDVRDETRTIRSLTFQELIRPHEDIDITVGARWDDFSDIGSQLSPRLSLVWRIGGNDVLKAQHAGAFRAPTFFETTGPGPQPDAERMETTEIGWIHRRPRTIVRATAFHSELADGLGPGPMGSTVNERTARVNGLETEWTQSFGDTVKLITNVSWVDPSEDSLVFGWSRWLGNIAVIVTPSPRWSFGARWYHVGERSTPTADEFDDFDWIDVTASVRDAGAEGFDIRFGVKNVLDEEFLHPIPGPVGVITPTYDDQAIWLSFAYRW